MAETYIRIKQTTYTVPNVAANDSARKIITLKKGDRILYGSVTPLVNSDNVANDSTISVGDSSGAAALMAATKMDATTSPSDTAIDMAALAAHGKPYSADDNVTVTYTKNTTPGSVAPIVRVTIAVVRGDLY